jgi:2'-5' RNA ligase
MRLFTGFPIAGNTRQKIETILEELRPEAKLRWSRPQNLHITAAFIGKWDEGRLAELKSALAQVEPSGPAAVTVTGFGFFPNPHHPHTMFLAVKADPALNAAATNITRALVGLGYEPEDRPWHPHITLARIARENITQLRFRIASMNNLFPLESFSIPEFHLYESRPEPGGSVYSALASFPLEAAAQ